MPSAINMRRTRDIAILLRGDGAGASRPPVGRALRRGELFLRVGDAVDLDTARLDTLFQWNRQQQHAVLVGGADAIEIEDPRHSHGLLPMTGAIIAAAILLGADHDGIAGNFERNGGRVDPGHRDLNTPTVLSRVDLKWVVDVRTDGAGRQVRPELIEQALGF